jgi:hypothetical protein
VSYLIKSNNKFYSYDNGWFEVSVTEPVTESDFENHGFDLSLVLDFNDLPDVIEVLHNTQEQKAFLEITTDSFSPISILNEKQFEVLTYLEEVKDSKLELQTNGHKPIFLLPSPNISTATDSGENLILKLGINVLNTVKYLVSLDNISFYGYDGGWRAGYEMSREQLQSISEIQWKELYDRMYQKDFYIKAILKNQISTSTPILKTITVQYAPNTPPEYEVTITPSEVSRETATIHVTYEDNEGDNVLYRVFIQKAGGAYEQVYPQEGFIPINIAGEITYSFNYTSLSTGQNKVKVELKDSRGAISTAEASITMVNQDPLFTAFTNTTWNVTGTIDDTDGDKVDVRLYINGVLKQDYLGFLDSPRNFYFEWDSPDLVLNQSNEIKIEVKDERGATLVETFNVVGTYRGLMFKDEEGYYTTDKAEILKLLDLGRIVAGQRSDPVRIMLENTSGYGVKDIEVYSRSEDLPPNATLRFAKSKDPFFGQDKIIFIGNLPHGEEYEFYASVETTAGRGKMRAPFTIEASPKV